MIRTQGDDKPKQDRRHDGDQKHVMGLRGGAIRMHARLKRRALGGLDQILHPIGDGARCRAGVALRQGGLQRRGARERLTGGRRPRDRFGSAPLRLPGW